MQAGIELVTYKFVKSGRTVPPLPHGFYVHARAHTLIGVSEVLQ